MWDVIQKKPTYHSDTWEAVWTGEGEPPHTPYGMPIPVFNTSEKKARKCAAYFNSFINGENE